MSRFGEGRFGEQRFGRVDAIGGRAEAVATLSGSVELQRAGQFGAPLFGVAPFGGRHDSLWGRADAPALPLLDLARRAALRATLSAGVTAGVSFTITTPLRPAPARALRVLRGAKVS
jgi:hypothetical protein